MQERAQEREFALREEVQNAEIELRRLAIDRAHDNEQAANYRLAAADQASIGYARRGQTFAMWFTAVSSGTLISAGLVCIFLAAAGVISQGLGLGAGAILISAGILTGIAKIAGKFLPDGHSDDDAPPES
jgi:hypothetical protein